MSYQFEEPLTNMTEFINNIKNDMNNQDNEYVENNEGQISCAEMKELYEYVMKLVSDIRFTNQIFLSDDAQALLDLSKAKVVYTRQFRDLGGVGKKKK